MKTTYFHLLVVFALTTAGCNVRGPNLVDLVQGPQNPTVLSSIASKVFPAPLEQGESFSASFTNRPGHSPWQSLMCTFDQRVDGVVTSGTDCTALPGFPATTFAGNTLSWTPNRAAWGPYEIAVRGTNAAGGSATSVFVVTVRPAYPLANLRGDWNALFASGLDSYTSSNVRWTDLTGNGFHGTLSDTVHASWVGSRLFSNPNALALNGSGRVGFDTGPLLGQTRLAFQTWANSTDPSLKGSVLVSNSGNGAGPGFTLRQSYRSTGGIELSLGQSYQDAVLAAGPIGYWRLNEAAGPTAYDISGRGNHGTYSGGGFTFAQASGLVGDTSQSALFNGTSSYVDVPGNSNLQVGSSLTISMWIRPTGLTVRRALFSNRTVAGVGEFNFETGTGAVGGVRRLALSTPGIFDAESVDGAVTNATWQHVAYTRSGTTQRLYVNGVSQTLLNDTPQTLIDNLNNHTIGYDARVASFYSGHISDVAFFNYPLSGPQILGQYQAGQGQFGAICYSTSTPAAGVWSFWGGIFDGTTASLFLNGAQECSVSAPASSLVSPSESLTVGATASGSSAWQGRMGELRVFGTSDGSAAGTAQQQHTGFEATADRFREVPVGGLITSGLVLHADAANANRLSAHANGCSTLSFFDLSSTLLTGALTNFAGCGASSGWLGSAATADPHRLRLDGVDDIVSFPHHTALNLVTAFSLGGWIRSPSLATHPSADLSIKNGWWNFSIGTPGPGQIRLADGGANGAYANSTLGNSTWHHIMAVKAGADLSTISIYVNGSLVSTSLLGATWSNATGSTATTLGGGANGHFSGDIAQWTVYNRALTSSEVNEVCKAAVSRFLGAACSH